MTYIHYQDHHGGSGSKEFVFNVKDPGSSPGLGRFAWRRAWQPTAVFLPGEFHRQRSWWATVPRSQRVRQTQ